MQSRGLIDTGAILALLDRSDRWHDACVEAFATAPLPLATSVAVLTELFHLLSPGDRELDAAWNLLGTGAIQLLTIDGQELPALEALMRRDKDRPMDFADATLVHLAQRESITYVLTVDFSDFATYRIGAKRTFDIHPVPTKPRR
jgi:predicted nucleic acid-binding protein